MNEPIAASATDTTVPESAGTDNAAASAKGDTAPKAAPAVKVDENGVATEGPKPFKTGKYNLNGKTVEKTWMTEAEMDRDLQKVFGIEEKAKTSAEKADQAEKLMTLLTSDYKGFVKQCKALGIDPDKLATDILYEKMRQDKMTPEQRQLEEYKEREAAAIAKAKADEEAAKVAETQRKTQEWASKFEKDCEAALKSNQLPKTRLSLALLAQYVDAGLAAKQELSVEQVIPYVARDLKEIHSSTMGRLDGEDLLNYLGEELSNKVAKARVERYKKSQAVTTPVQKLATNPTTAKGEDISKLKGKAYWAAVRRMKSEAGVGFYPGMKE